MHMTNLYELVKTGLLKNLWDFRILEFYAL